MQSNSSKNSGSPVDLVIRLFNERGDSEYGGEAVTQLEHALQSALLAEESGSPPALIAAALLHDAGHLLHHLPDDAPESGIDDKHEDLAARWLSKYFGPDVVEPVRLHVSAKRYLCAVDKKYMSELSPPSALSLQLQGGPMSPEEVQQFETNPHFEAAVALRKWDDTAKVPGAETPSLEYFSKYLKLSRPADEA